MEMDTLQKLIEKRAAKKLDSDIATIARLVINNRLLNQDDTNLTPGIYVYAESKEHQHQTIHDTLAFDNVWRRKLRENWLPTYIKEVTELFLQDHDQMTQQIQDLQSEVEEIRRNQNG